MNHAQAFLATLAHVEAAMSVESTVAELAPHVTRDQAALLIDAANWLREIVAAKPKIQPAKTWGTPTDLRREVARRTGAAREFVGRRRGR